MKRFQTAAVFAAVAIAVVGCKQGNQGGLGDRSDSDRGSSKSEMKTIDQSAKDAKDSIEAQAKAQKERIEAEAAAAKAQIKAEQADIKARTNNAQQVVDSSAQKIRDAAGSASAQVQRDAGSQSSPAPASSGANTSSTSTSTTDQSLTDLVKNAVGANATASKDAGNDVQVTVSNGTVTLAGTVASEEEKTTKEKQAKAVAGVTDVKNELQVKAK